MPDPSGTATAVASVPITLTFKDVTSETIEVEFDKSPVQWDMSGSSGIEVLPDPGSPGSTVNLKSLKITSTQIRIVPADTTAFVIRLWVAGAATEFTGRLDLTAGSLVVYNRTNDETRTATSDVPEFTIPLR